MEPGKALGSIVADPVHSHTLDGTRLEGMGTKEDKFQVSWNVSKGHKSLILLLRSCAFLDRFCMCECVCAPAHMRTFAWVHMFVCVYVCVYACESQKYLLQLFSLRCLEQALLLNMELSDQLVWLTCQP